MFVVCMFCLVNVRWLCVFVCGWAVCASVLRVCFACLCVVCLCVWYSLCGLCVCCVWCVCVV